MWHRLAQKLTMRGFGSFPTRSRSTTQVATPGEAEQLGQQAVTRQRQKPWTHLTLEEKLEGMYNRDGRMGPPGSIPDALLNSEGVQGAGIADQHETVSPSGSASRGPTFDDGFPENPNPGARLRIRR